MTADQIIEEDAKKVLTYLQPNDRRRLDAYIQLERDRALEGRNRMDMLMLAAMYGGIFFWSSAASSASRAPVWNRSGQPGPRRSDGAQDPASTLPEMPGA